MPAPEHGGEHADDCISRMERLLRDEPDGSCETSGMEFQRIRRSLEVGPDETAAHTLEESMSEPAAVDVESREAFVEGSALNVDGPE